MFLILGKVNLNVKEPSVVLNKKKRSYGDLHFAIEKLNTIFMAEHNELGNQGRITGVSAKKRLCYFRNQLDFQKRNRYY
jgi:hypothetical protein